MFTPLWPCSLIVEFHTFTVKTSERNRAGLFLFPCSLIDRMFDFGSDGRGLNPCEEVFKFKIYK